MAILNCEQPRIVSVVIRDIYELDELDSYYDRKTDDQAVHGATLDFATPAPCLPRSASTSSTMRVDPGGTPAAVCSWQCYVNCQVDGKLPLARLVQTNSVVWANDRDNAGASLRVLSDVDDGYERDISRLATKLINDRCEEVGSRIIQYERGRVACPNL